MNIFFRSVAVGVVAAIAVGVLAFALAPFFDAVGMYVAPAGLFIPVLGRIIPTAVVYKLIPDGGPVAGVFLILASTLLFWTFILGALYFGWITLRRRRSAKRAMATS
jgi:hypothetical protein